MGTTMLAAMKASRNSIGVEIDPKYCEMTLRRLRSEVTGLFSREEIEFVKVDDLRRELTEAFPGSVVRSPSPRWRRGGKLRGKKK